MHTAIGIISYRFPVHKVPNIFWGECIFLALVTYRKVTLYGSFEIVTIYVFEYGKDHPSIKPIMYVCKLSKAYFPVPWQSIVHLFYTKEKPKHAITMRRKRIR